MSTDKNNKLQASSPQLWQLEPRLMFDGAAVDTTVDALVDGGADLPVAEAADGLFALAVAHEQTRPAAELAQQQIKDYLSEASAEQLFALFNGGKSEIDMAWLQAMEAQRQAILSGQIQLDVELLDNAAMQGALGAFAESGPAGTAVIYLNRDWIEAGADTDDVARVLAEEFGHSIDARVNSGADTAGDEGERFAAAVTGADASMPGLGMDNDHGSVLVDGEAIAVEQARLEASAVVNAYVVKAENTPAGKESNTHDFIYKADPATVTIDDAQASRLFSGNDVSATVTIDGTEHHGWISRPIKVKGDVKGFYFWTDTQFTNLTTAQDDGNSDGDRNVADNSGFVLVVDQAYFTTLANGAADDSILNIGSSSDRVDAALNQFVGDIVPPVAVADSDTATEDGDVINGNVLTNDSGTDNTVTAIGTTSASEAVIAGTTSTNGKEVAGLYGTLTMGANGSYSYAVDNSKDAVQALGSSDSLTDTFTYTLTDGEGLTATTTLTVTVQGANDAPVAVDDYNVAKESTTAAGSGFDYTGKNAVGNVLDNDTDVDGESQTVTGVASEGTATGSTAATATVIGSLLPTLQ